MISMYVPNCFFFLNWGSVRFKLQLNLCSHGKFAMISNPAAINIPLSTVAFCSYGLFLSWCYSMRLCSQICYADMLMFHSVNLLNWGSVHRLWSSIYNVLPLCYAMLKFLICKSAFCKFAMICIKFCSTTFCSQTTSMATLHFHGNSLFT